MIISSPVFEDGKSIPALFTRDGLNQSPPIVFSGVPPSAKSLVLIVDDPDVPRSLRPDGIFVHWLVWNIPPATKGIPQGGIPPGVSGLATNKQMGYTGPNPPNGEHRYYFRLYALDTELMIGSTVTKAELLLAMQGHMLDQAELMGRYQRAD